LRVFYQFSPQHTLIGRQNRVPFANIQNQSERRIHEPATEAGRDFAGFFWGILFCSGMFFAAPGANALPDSIRGGAPADTGKTGDYRSSPDYFRNVTLKVIYAWNPEEPDFYSKVNCLLVRQANLITEIKVFQEHAA
jgi:hypothetical protein